MTNKDKLIQILYEVWEADPHEISTNKVLPKAKQAIQKDYIEKSELPEHKPFKCEKGHVQVKKCQFGHEIYAHPARWCCACDADIAFATAWVKDEPEFKDKYIEKSRVKILQLELLEKTFETLGYKMSDTEWGYIDIDSDEVNNAYRKLKTQLGLEEKNE